MTEPKNAIIKQYQHLFTLEGAELEFADDALHFLADKALARNTGARALRGADRPRRSSPWALVNAPGGFGVGVHPNAHYATAVACAWNDWLEKNWMGKDPRIRISIGVALQDVADLRRTHGLGAGLLHLLERRHLVL